MASLVEADGILRARSEIISAGLLAFSLALKWLQQHCHLLPLNLTLSQLGLTFSATPGVSVGESETSIELALVNTK